MVYFWDREIWLCIDPCLQHSSQESKYSLSDRQWTDKMSIVKVKEVTDVEEQSGNGSVACNMDHAQEVW